MATRDALAEKEAIRDYFNKGFTHHEILALLEKYHDIRMSIAMLKRRMGEYGKEYRLRRRFNLIRDELRGLLDGPDCLLGGYRHIWHTLKMKGISVPRTVVEKLLKELDPKGTAARRAHRLQRSTYRNNGKISMIVFLHKQPRKVMLCQYNQGHQTASFVKYLFGGG